MTLHGRDAHDTKNALPLLAVAPDRLDRPRKFDAAANERLDALELSRPPVSVGGSRAYVRVQRGCDKFCSYCIVPYVRGSEQSRRPGAIVEEIRRLADGGCKEVTLLGQTVNSYRYAAGGRTATLADLLAQADGVGGIERVRFVTSYPAEFDETLLQAIRDLPSVCEYLHIPAQSGSDRVLRAMNRRYSISQYMEVIDAARRTIPGVVLAGDFIVGFSGESDEDFEASCELVRRAGYKNSFIFKYSPREGTAAARKLPDDVSEETKKLRNNALLAAQDEVGLAHHQAMVGQSVQVLVEGPSRRADRQPTPAPDGQGQLMGRTRGDHIVVFNGPKHLAGQMVNVNITGASALVLMGEL